MKKLFISIILAVLLFGILHTFNSASTKQKPTENTIITSFEGNFTTQKEKAEKSGVLSVSGLSVAELEENTLAPLSQYAFYFIEAEQQTGVNAVFLASVAALESGWGTSDLAKDKNNLYGWTSNSGEMKSFNSVGQCILYVAENLKEHYLTPNGKYFNGYEVEDINKHYNGREEWAVAVTGIMKQVERS